MPLELVITEGLFILDGGEWEVTNNVWLVGNDREVMVIDAGHDHAPIVEAVAGRRVTSIASTHGHNDHINSAVALRDEVDAPILLHPDDRMLWDMVYADDAPDRDLAHGATLRAAGHELAVIHTPGHSPGSCCFWDAGSGLMFSGDTLFNGGPGATGRSFSDRPTLLRSIRDMLLVLPDETIVHTGHGDSTTIGSERAGLLDHIARLEVD
ncbi:MAG: MBL fold metallo-hydrolase [Acidimicrobiia bacterium]|nr:MBL fold metallo-hydrolase [Acidimicrobiia bacterium]MYC85308.1 MBL fold metallo-hydrolase [Acidimicrobiia bacterium]